MPQHGTKFPFLTFFIFQQWRPLAQTAATSSSPPVAEVAPHRRGRPGGGWPIRASLVANIASLHDGDRVGSSGCCRVRWRDEIGELSLPTTHLSVLDVYLQWMLVGVFANFLTAIIEVDQEECTHCRTHSNHDGFDHLMTGTSYRTEHNNYDINQRFVPVV